MVMMERIEGMEGTEGADEIEETNVVADAEETDVDDEEEMGKEGEGFGGKERRAKSRGEEEVTVEE